MPASYANAKGENLEVDPPRRLVQSSTRSGATTSRRRGLTGHVGIEPVGDSAGCSSRTTTCARGDDEVYGGWPQIPFGAEDAARDRREPDHARLVAVRAGVAPAPVSRPPGTNDASR